MRVHANSPMGALHTVVDENGKEIKYVEAWDTETKQAVVYITKDGRIQDDSHGNVLTKVVHLPKARLIHVDDLGKPLFDKVCDWTDCFREATHFDDDAKYCKNHWENNI